MLACLFELLLCFLQFCGSHGYKDLWLSDPSVLPPSDGILKSLGTGFGIGSLKVNPHINGQFCGKGAKNIH